MAYEIEFTSEFEIWWDGLTVEEQDALDHVIGMLAVDGHRLGRPHADVIRESSFANMKELRTRIATSHLRVFFIFDPRRVAILLLGGNKVGKNQEAWYKMMAAKADAIYREYLKEIERE